MNLEYSHRHQIYCSYKCLGGSQYKGNAPLHKEIKRAFWWWREAVMERDNYTCQGCFKRGVELNADHIIPFSILVDIEDYGMLADLDNGRTLCIDCHRKTDTWGVKLSVLKERYGHLYV